MLYVKCLYVVLLSQPNSRNLDYLLCDVHGPEEKMYKKSVRHIQIWKPCSTAASQDAIFIIPSEIQSI